MPCIGDGSVGGRTLLPVLRNWSRTHQVQPPFLIAPGSVAELAAAVQSVENGGGVARAIGSHWSYTQVALTREVTHVIDIAALAAILNGDDASGTATLLPFALTDVARARASNLVHVEAGIKIHALNCALEARSKAMPTLGGSNGQSLAGVLGTATHGSDVDLPPIADHVRAIHLVGPGAQEWWIEPDEGTGNITLRSRLEAARDAGRLCNDIRIAYDSALFDAVLVSAGRMGVIYAVVVEVVDAFNLREDRERINWTLARERIRTKVIDASVPYPGPRFMEVVVNPYANASGERVAIVCERNVTTEPSNEKTSPDYFSFFCNLQPLTPILSGILAVIPALIAAVAAAAVAGLAWMLAIPIIGPILYTSAATTAIAAATTGILALQTAITTLLQFPGENMAARLATIVNRATGLNLKLVVPAMVDALVGFIRDPGAAPIVNSSFRVATSQPPCSQAWRDLPECLREIDGMEFALPATAGSTRLFDFMDDIFALTREFYDNNLPPAFGLSIRFTRGTRASIGMQQFARTASVEFLILRGIAGHEEFKRRVHAIARTRGAIPHWGLIHELDADQVARLYGRRLVDWRRQLHRLITAGGGRTETFRTSFSVSRGLEPLAAFEVLGNAVAAINALLLDEDDETSREPEHLLANGFGAISALLLDDDDRARERENLLAGGLAAMSALLLDEDSEAAGAATSWMAGQH